MVELLSLLWLFMPSQPALSTLSVQAPQAEFTCPGGTTNSFTIKLTVNLGEFTGEKLILEIPNVLGVRLRQHDPLDRDRQNYPAFKMPEGTAPVLEATLALRSLEHPDWKTMTIGIPLAMLSRPYGKHDIVLNFSGANWTIYVDGEPLDNDFPFGYPEWRGANVWKADPLFVQSAALYLPAIKPEKRRAPARKTAPGIQYWLPKGHNNWVGDVETFYHKGRFHVFYLYDRRHHQSKFGCGAHYFEHLSTKDLKTWTEHEAATPLEEQWECIGTGVPFLYKNQLCLSYGLHTTRVYPEEKTTLPAQWEYLKKHGRTGTFQRDSASGMPVGATYSVSADGIAAFRKSGIMFHPCQNPSVYIDPAGKLRMLANYGAKGMWESETLDGGWHCVNPEFPPGGDCTIFFRWGKFDYIMGGFTGLWRKPANTPDSAYEDLVRQGLDCYDGLNVPSITRIDKGRFLMTGWIPIRGWGGTLVLRELLQSSGGTLGSKWLAEATPKTSKPMVLAPSISETTTLPAHHRSFLLTFQVRPAAPGKGSCSVSFLPENNSHAAGELQIALHERRAQFGPASSNGFGARQKSLREGGAPHHVGNYAIENLPGADESFAVRVIVKYDHKLGGSLIDAELAGRRTMICYRPDLTVTKLLFRTEDVELRRVQLGALRADGTE